MSNENKKCGSGKFFIGAALGAIAGAVAGIVMAPKSGEETRKDIKELGDKIMGMTLKEAKELSDYLKESDVIITKPGGITTFEAIKARTPLYVIEPTLEQELGNDINGISVDLVLFARIAYLFRIGIDERRLKGVGLPEHKVMSL